MRPTLPSGFNFYFFLKRLSTNTFKGWKSHSHKVPLYFAAVFMLIIHTLHNFTHRGLTFEFTAVQWLFTNTGVCFRHTDLLQEQERRGLPLPSVSMEVPSRGWDTSWWCWADRLWSDPVWSVVDTRNFSTDQKTWHKKWTCSDGDYSPCSIAEGFLVVLSTHRSTPAVAPQCCVRTDGWGLAHW